jgi:hypothetical protein
MKNVKSLLLIVLLLVGTLAVAQGFDDIFGEDGGDDALLAESGSDAAGLTVDIRGSVGAEFGFFFDDELDSEVAAEPSADLIFTASVPAAQAVLSLNVDTSEAVGWDLASSLVDEIYVTSYFGAGHLTFGLMRREWGVGDGIHAIDPLNATDQSEGPVSDYLESRVPEALLDLNIYLGTSGLLELIYKPFFHPTQVAISGRWMVIDPATIPGYSSIEPVNVRTLSYSQAATRLSGSVGPADLGFQYYYGFMPEPGYAFTTTFTGTDPMNPDHYTTTAEIVYTRAHLFGTEAAAALGPFTLRGEAGYWLSEDTDGTVPELYNSRVVYLAGFDFTIPGTSVFASAQVQGEYTTSTADLSAEDVDRFRLYDDEATSHLIIGAIEAPFARDTINLRLAAVYAVEAGGFIIVPEYSWTIADAAELSIAGTIIGGESLSSGNSPYYAWRYNDNVSLSLRYRF